MAAEHLAASRRAVAEMELSDHSLLVDALGIDALATRSGDTYIWHMEPGTVRRESPLLQARMAEAGVRDDARLAHGVLGVMFALRAAYAQDRDLPIRGIADVRYSIPVFEGAHLSVMIEPCEGGTDSFLVMTDQFEPNLAISGQLLYGPVLPGGDPERFISLAEQQLFTLEESIGLVSALIGPWVQESGAWVLYMGQKLELLSLVSPGDTLDASGEILERQPHKRGGERIRLGITVRANESAVASGDSLFLYTEQPL